MGAEPTATNKMGFFSCTSYVIGSIIGSGIFITPSSIIGYTHSVGLSLLVWIFCAIISLLSAIVYIELGTSILEPGCDFAYTVYVGWEAIAFAFMLVSVVLTFPASAAVQSVTFGQYIVEALSPVIEFDDTWSYVCTKAIGVSLLLSLTFLNFFSLEKFAARFQIVVTIAKVFAMLIIIVTGFYLLIFKGQTQNFADIMGNSNWNPGSLALAFYGGLWSYAGWDILNYGTPEIHKPRRTMPLSLMSGIIVVCLIYVAINVAYFAVLTPDEVQNSQAVAADFANRALGDFSYAIPVMIAILLMGTLNSNIFCGSRMMHAAAREGHMPPFLSGVHTMSGSPRAAILAQGLLATAMCFVHIETLINYVTFVMWGQRVVTAAALLWLRYRKMPVDQGAIRVPITLTVILLVISIALVVVPIVTEFLVTTIGFGVVLVGVGLYFLFVKPNSTLKPIEAINDVFARIVIRLLNVELDVKKNRQVLDEVRKEETESLRNSRE